MTGALMLFGGLLACVCLLLGALDWLGNRYPMGC